MDAASDFVKLGGAHLIIDEIHQYPDWSTELKLIYDYHPDLQVVFTGSSVLDIKKGSSDYLLYMEEAGMVSQLRSEANGIRALGKVDKVYLDNTNLVYGLAREHPNKGNIRETFFMNQLRVAYPIVSSKMADFAIDAFDFDIGGKNKSSKQIKTAAVAFWVIVLIFCVCDQNLWP